MNRNICKYINYIREDRKIKKKRRKDLIDFVMNK